MFNGILLVKSNMLTKGSIRLPKRKNKSKRIQKKWNKKYGFNSIPIPDPQIYIVDGKCIGHPKTLEKITKGLKNMKEGSYGNNFK